MTISAAQHQAHDVPPAAGGPPGPSGYWVHLSHALQGLLGLYLLVHVAEAALFTWTSSTLAGWADRPRTYDYATALEVDRWTVLVTVTDLLAVALIGACFITWLFLAHRSPRMYRPALRHGSGWAIGGWFVPILNLWRPLQVVHDVRRGAVGHEPARGGVLVGSWWASCLLTGLLARISVAMVPGEDERPRAYLSALHRGAVVDLATTAVSAVSVVLAIAVVRHVTALVRLPA